MIFLRSILFSLGLVFITPVFFVLGVFTLPFSLATRYRVISQWSRIMLWWLKISCAVDYKVVGRENIPTKPSIILAKHQSAWETLAFQQIFPPQVWVVKRELLKLPFFGWGLAILKPIAIDRGSARHALKHLVSEGKKRLALGFWVVIFPEGTRVAPGKKGKYNPGGAWLAAQTGAAVVPVAHNAGLFWPRNSFIKYPGCITVKIGRPLNPAGLAASAINEKVEQWIEEQMTELNVEV